MPPGRRVCFPGDADLPVTVSPCLLLANPRLNNQAGLSLLCPWRGSAKPFVYCHKAMALDSGDRPVPCWLWVSVDLVPSSSHIEQGSEPLWTSQGDQISVISREKGSRDWTCKGRRCEDDALLFPVGLKFSAGCWHFQGSQGAASPQLAQSAVSECVMGPLQHRSPCPTH